MKITIELSAAEVAGIKSYLKEVDGNENPKKADIAEYCNGELKGIFSAPGCAVSDYINAQTKN